MAANLAEPSIQVLWGPIPGIQLVFGEEGDSKDIPRFYGPMFLVFASGTKRDYKQSFPVCGGRGGSLQSGVDCWFFVMPFHSGHINGCVIPVFHLPASTQLARVAPSQRDSWGVRALRRSDAKGRSCATSLRPQNQCNNFQDNFVFCTWQHILANVFSSSSE